MKKFKLNILLLMILASSCGKELEEEILGTWIVVEASVDDCEIDKENMTYEGFSEVACIAGQSNTECVYSLLNFTDINYSYSNQTISNEMVDVEAGVGSYTLSDVAETLTICEDDECDSYSIVIDGNNMTLSRLEPDTGAGCQRVIICKRKS